MKLKKADYRALRARSNREIRLVVPKPEALIRVAVGFPNRYEIGMSNLGWQVVFRELNERPDTSCERFFLSEREDVFTVENRRPLDRFDIVGFSLSFEPDFLNVPVILRQAGIPVKSAERTQIHPLVIAGGTAVTFNPEPMAEIMDFFIIGDAETLIHRVIDVYSRAKRIHAERRKILLELSAVDGVYVPAFFKIGYNSDGTIAAIHPGKKIRKHTAVLNRPAVSAVMSPDTEFGLAYLAEIIRGCGWQCRFCVTGRINMPVRPLPPDAVLSEARKAASLGVKFGLVGTAVSSYPRIESLCAEFVKTGLKCAFSSLRLDKSIESLIDLMAESGQKTVTLAPETALAKLQKFIGKQISTGDLAHSIEYAVAHGIPNIKLYYMIGLAGSGIEEVSAIAEQVKSLLRVFRAASSRKRKIGRIIVSVTPFVPKPWTPFQWEKMAAQEELSGKIRFLRGQLKTERNLNLQFASLHETQIQAVLARADRRISDFIIDEKKSSGKLDADKFGFYLYRERGSDEIFPWDIIDTGISRKLLWEERKEALKN